MLAVVAVVAVCLEDHQVVILDQVVVAGAVGQETLQVTPGNPLLTTEETIAARVAVVVALRQDQWEETAVRV
jgi:hypothetical protein